MLRVDIVFGFARVYNVDKVVQVMAGQKFKLIVNQRQGPVKWFTDNDPVLKMDVNGSVADIEATAPGKSTVVIKQHRYKYSKHIEITVVETINDKAVTLGPTAGPAVPK